MDQPGSDPAKEIEDEVTGMTEPVLHVIPEDIKEPHVAEDVKEAAVEKHRSDEGEDLLEGRKLGGETRVGIPDGNNSVEEESFLQMGTLGELPEEGKAIGGNDENIDHRERL
jgi:hypothetical protein